MTKKNSDFKITPMNYFASAIGNAKYSDVEISLDEIWETIKLSETEEEFDSAIGSLIALKTIVKKGKK